VLPREEGLSLDNVLSISNIEGRDTTEFGEEAVGSSELATGVLVKYVATLFE